MKIYVIRHGQTPWNVVRRLQGRSDTELNEKGRETAVRTGLAFRDIPFYMVFTSPLKRAKETAKLFLGDRVVPMIEDERIAEISFGCYEGLICAEDSPDSLSREKAPGTAENHIPDKEFMNFFDHPERYRTPPGGESLDELGARCRDFMEDIMHREELSDKNILVASHGCATRGILNSIREFEPADFWHGGVPKNCSVALIEVQNGVPSLIYENKTFF